MSRSDATSRREGLEAEKKHWHAMVDAILKASALLAVVSYLITIGARYSNCNPGTLKVLIAAPVLFVGVLLFAVAIKLIFLEFQKDPTSKSITNKFLAKLKSIVWMVLLGAAAGCVIRVMISAFAHEAPVRECLPHEPGYVAISESN